MYRNKKDIDRHVDGLLAKLSPKEFNSRAYSVARLYFEVGDYASCQRYVEQYLSQKDNNAAAHKLLGQAFHKLGQKEKAMDQFRKSLDLDPTQTSLILDICELLSDDEVLVDFGRAKYWCEKAEAIFPRHPVTFRLREKLLATDNPDPEAVINLLTTELAARPKDAVLHARLLKHYLQNNKVKEAFDHSFNVEFSDNNFVNNIAWYEAVSEILKKHSGSLQEWHYQLFLLTVRERLCALGITETPNGPSKSLIECSELLQQYDQALHAVAKAGAPSGFAEFHSGLVLHHLGQFSIHIATLFLKRAKKDQLSWRDAKKFAAPLMLIAWHTIPLDTKVNWLNHAPDKLVQAVHRWYSEGTYRCSQSGHYILSNTREKHHQFLDNVGQTCSGKNWREKYYDKTFPTKDQAAKKNSSFLLSDTFTGPTLRLPRNSEVEAYDADAQHCYPNSLHHFVWILMNYKNYADFKCNLFDMLTPKTSNYQNCGPETLSKLDVYAFLYCAAFTAEQKTQQIGFDSSDKPLLPANIADLLCPPSQMKWWDCAYKFSQNTLGTELTDIRVTLSRGIEVVRCIDNHGMDPELLCKVARIFSELAAATMGVDDKNYFEMRAELYFSSAVANLEKIKNNVTVRIPDKRMFAYSHKELATKYLNALIEECRLYVAVSYIKESEYDKAIEMLSSLKSPQAYFHMAETYKKMALEEFNLSKDTNPEVKSKSTALLSKARHFAYKTIDILKELQEDTKHALFSKTHLILEDIESNANRFDLDTSAANFNDTEAKFSSDDNGSLLGNDYARTRHNPQVFRNLSSTPKQVVNRNQSNYRTAVDTQLFENSRTDQMLRGQDDVKYLERIEDQIKNIQKRDSNVNSFIDQTKTWFEENKDLGKMIGTINANLQNTTEQFKQLKISVDQVKIQIDECKTECKDVGELKKQVAELRKEMSKLKKASSEQAIDESEVYSLEDEYRTNDNASSYSSQLPFTNAQVLPQLGQRLVPPFQVPPNPYQLYGQNLYNFYNQYSQFAQGSVPATSPMFDVNRPQVNFPGMFPTAEQMYPDMGHLLGAASAPAPVLPAGPAMPPVLPSVIPPVMPSGPPVPAPVSVSAPPPMVTIPKSVAPIQTKDTARSLPVNVVITSSDPLPTCTTVPQPVLSVTIPPKHIKGTPHNYQIAMPPTSDNQVMTPSIFSSSILGNITPSKPNWSQSIDFKTTPSNSLDSKGNTPNTTFSLFDSIKTPTTVFDGAISSPNTSLNKSRTLSEKSNTSVDNYDPCPDFKPIVPLPAEVKVTTGEEDETSVFSARAKLFRFVDKQWKERGLGELKLLKHKVTEKVRVLMRREQVHKICANHIITPEMEINQMKNETKAYIWVANDYADETVVLEKFCVRFKTPDIAKEFYETFENARQSANTSITETSKADKKAESVFGKPSKDNVTSTSEKITNVTSQESKTVIGGFTFNSTPTFKLVKDEKPESKPTEVQTSTVNPFNSVSFNTNNPSPFSGLFKIASESTSSNNSQQTSDTTSKLNNSDTVEEYEPTIEFKPVVPLPALIETKTGEEDEIVLFEHRAKLFRFVAASKEWKERGLGNIKLLAHKDYPQRVRLLMRREQVMKVCCNHAITKDLVFEKMTNSDKAVTWCAKDFSEGELVSETFCLRFKSVDICNQFTEAVKTAQSKLKDESKAAKEEQNAAKQTTSQSGFGDKFKPKTGSWQCDACYTNNLESFTKCACCEQPNPSAKTTETATKTPSSNWGDKFKPKVGSWECKQCFIRNDANKDICVACNSPKDPSAVKNESKSVLGSSGFTFGIPQTTQPAPNAAPVKETSVAAGWGDKYKPKEGSWECKQCFVRNDCKSDQCCACNSPKDPNATKKESTSIFDSVASGPKFSFGIPSTVLDVKPAAVSAPSTIFDGSGSHKFSFGIPAATSDTASTPGINNTGIIYAAPTKPQGQSAIPVNISIKKIGDTNVTVKPALQQTPTKDCTTFGTETSGKFDFVFKPKTPTSVKSPKSDKADESDGNDYASEDEGHHIHFSPVIPMPDKVEVVTGEEDEAELYGHRAKLFRYIGGEWKERGIGVVKILQHKVTGKLRVVMRREHVLKICLNHALTPEITYTPKDDKTWLFAANDFSDGELTISQFCLRFKSKEIAEKFKEALDKAVAGKSGSSRAKDSDSDEVVFVSETQATAEEKSRAKELMLPENFFTYKNKEACPGCRGCEESEDAAAAPAPAPGSLAAAAPAPAPGFLAAAAPAPAPGSLAAAAPAPAPGSLAAAAPAPAPGSLAAAAPVPAPGSRAAAAPAPAPGSLAAAAPAPGAAAPASPAALGTPIKTPSFQSPFTTPANFNKTSDTSIFRTPLDCIQSNKITPQDIFSNKNAPSVPLPFFNFGGVFGTSQDKPSVFNVTNFSTPTTTKSSILAAPKLNTSNEDSTKEQKSDPKSIFGSAQSKLTFETTSSSDNKSIFGAPSTATAFSTSTGVKPVFGGSIFGSAAPGTSLFGTNNVKDEQKPEVKSIFGGDSYGNTDNIFNSNAKGSIFGPASTKDIPSTGSIFSKTEGSVFGSNTGPVFGGGKSLFGSSSQPRWNFSGNKDNATEKTDEAAKTTTTSKVPEVKTNDTGKETAVQETPFSVDNGLSFAALSSATAEPGFKQKEDFQWEGAGASLFGGKQAAGASQDKSTNDSGAGESAGAEEEYDPHYEPIVPLPDKITVTTGEEDEEKLFGERSKLYRFDDKTREWKERGVGELKILFHPARNSYRMLLRREQIHKAVLNMLLFPDLELLPLKNSDRAWTWVGRNYAESAAGDQEMLALRFKSVDLAVAFHAKVVECVRKLQAAAAQAIREEKEGTKEKKDEPFTVAPLRLPKHLGDSARADPAISQATLLTTASASSAAANAPTNVKATNGEAKEEDEEEEGGEDEEDYDHNYDEYEDYEGYYNEEEAIYFACSGSVTVAQGGARRECNDVQLQVLYDQEMYSPKILVTDAATGEILADMLIHTDTEFQVSGESCTWSGTDYTAAEPEDKTVTATFPDADTANQFYDSCEESKTATYQSTDPES